MNDGEVARLKIVISMNSSTSFTECDRLFIRDFLLYDKMITDKIKAENDAMEAINQRTT
jgi:hypothetical protein